MIDTDPPLSAPFLALFASSFCEAQRRQTRHLALSAKFQDPSDSAWQIVLPDRLFGLSGLGLFHFDFFATSAHGELLFVDANHPMVTHGRVSPPGPESAIARLRALHPDVPELQASSLASSQDDDVLAHGVCSIAALATDALFYYRCPNDALPGAAVWILVTEAVATPPASQLPSNLASLAPPRQDFGSYEAVVAAFDAARPAGQAARLNEFRVNFMAALSVAFPQGVTMEALFRGFLTHNGYGVRESTRTSDEGEALVDVVVEIVGGTFATPAMTATFDTMGRMRTINMTITADAYAADD